MAGSCAGPGRLWSLCNLLMAVFFGLAAAVQINDPDAGLWIVVYVVPAVLTLLVGLNPSITGRICDGLHSCGAAKELFPRNSESEIHLELAFVNSVSSPEFLHHSKHLDT